MDGDGALIDVLTKAKDELATAGPEMQTLSAGQTIGSYDPRTNQYTPAYTAPTVQETPLSVREAAHMGFDLRTADGRAAYGMFKQMQTRQAAGSNVTVNLPEAARENPWTPVGMDRVKAADEVLAQSASIMPELSAMEKAIHAGALQGMGNWPDPSIKTPWGTMGFSSEAAAVWAYQFGSWLGIADPKRMQATELFEAIQSRLTPMLRPAGSGSASDADMQLFLNALPNLSRTADGNLRIIDFYRKAYERNVQEMEILETMIEDGTYTPSKFRRETAKLGDLWSEEDTAALDAAHEPAAHYVAPESPPAGDAAPMPEGGISTMTPDQIRALDMSSLSASERAEVANRMSQLGM
jgi:hypothetical protein